MVEIKHLCLCLLFSSTHFSVYKDTFAFCKDTKCVQGHAILMPGFKLFYLALHFHLYIIGLTNDGEFSSVRTSGGNGPISIIDVIRMAKEEAQNMKESTVTKYFMLDRQGMERFLYNMERKSNEYKVIFQLKS